MLRSSADVVTPGLHMSKDGCMKTKIRGTGTAPQRATQLAWLKCMTGTERHCIISELIRVFCSFMLCLSVQINITWNIMLFYILHSCRNKTTAPCELNVLSEETH